MKKKRNPGVNACGKSACERGWNDAPAEMAIAKRNEKMILTTRPEPMRKRCALVRGFHWWKLAAAGAAVAMLCAVGPAALTYAAKDRDLPSPGLSTEISASIEDVLQSLQEVLHDPTIHGTSMFDKDKTLTGATVVNSTPLFEPIHGSGDVFYKVRTNAIAPRHFLDSADRGTVAVRYVVTSEGPERTRLWVSAVFVEDARHGSHPSDGSVESSETKLIQEKAQAILDARQEAAENQRRQQSIDLAAQSLVRQRQEESARLSSAESSARDLQGQVEALRHELEMRIKAPGATLKSAPFRSAADVGPLSAYTDVLIVIVTPHWYGVETPGGQRGWLPLDELGPLP
jgi:uncharacterized membrane protein